MMNIEQEREEIRKKAEELHAAICKTDENLAGLPFKSETETMRLAMLELQQQLHRMEDNLQALLKNAPETEEQDKQSD